MYRMGNSTGLHLFKQGNHLGTNDQFSRRRSSMKVKGNNKNSKILNDKFVRMINKTMVLKDDSRKSENDLWDCYGASQYHHHTQSTNYICQYA